jgi:type IV secretory pathway VirB2 component (pilin)
VPARSPDGARERARDVLAQQRFQRTSVPAPLRSVRESIGAGLRSLGRPFEDAFQWIVSWIPGGRAVLWALLATVLLGAAALLAGRTGPDRVGVAVAAAGAGDPQGMSPARLRQEADRAERSGNLDEALRLRFRAGLVDLDSRELIELRPALTNHELLRDVPSATLAGLVDGFESVAYGGRPADPDDLRTARDGWPRVPGEALDP